MILIIWNLVSYGFQNSNPKFFRHLGTTRLETLYVLNFANNVIWFSFLFHSEKYRTIQCRTYISYSLLYRKSGVVLLIPNHKFFVKLTQKLFLQLFGKNFVKPVSYFRQNHKKSSQFTNLLIFVKVRRFHEIFLL